MSSRGLNLHFLLYLGGSTQGGVNSNYSSSLEDVLLLPLDVAIRKSVEACGSEEMKKKMFVCILLVGGGIRFKGVARYLHQRLAIQVNVVFFFSLSCTNTIYDGTNSWKKGDVVSSKASEIFTPRSSRSVDQTAYRLRYALANNTVFCTVLFISSIYSKSVWRNLFIKIESLIQVMNLTSTINLSDSANVPNRTSGNHFGCQGAMDQAWWVAKNGAKTSSRKSSISLDMIYFITNFLYLPKKYLFYNSCISSKIRQFFI